MKIVAIRILIVFAILAILCASQTAKADNQLPLKLGAYRSDTKDNSMPEIISYYINN
jgi:hypothetical protein